MRGDIKESFWRYGCHNSACMGFVKRGTPVEIAFGMNDDCEYSFVVALSNRLSSK